MKPSTIWSFFFCILDSGQLLHILCFCTFVSPVPYCSSCLSLLLSSVYNCLICFVILLSYYLLLHTDTGPQHEGPWPGVRLQRGCAVPHLLLSHLNHQGVHACACVWVYVCTSSRVCASSCVYVCVCMFVCACVCMCVGICMCILLCVSLYVHVHMLDEVMAEERSIVYLKRTLEIKHAIQ